MNSPRGLTTAQPTIAVVRTFGRSGAGTRRVVIVCRLGLTRPFATPDRRIRPASANAGSGSQSSQSGSAWNIANVAITASPANRRVR